jgi:predicted nucleotidyltransferase component of viral defense system
MISKEQLQLLAAEWQLTEEVVEKDYVLGWLLWGIGTDQVLGDRWVFKGGTCLKKCYLETYRFSEDLDFTVTDAGPLTESEVLPVLNPILDRVRQASGIDFRGRAPRIQMRPNGRSAEGAVYYQGPRGAPGVARVKLDLTRNEVVVQPPVLRPISHPYYDSLPEPSEIRCYAFEELFAEKLRAMGERSRPRDLYDIINLFRRDDLRRLPELVASVLVRKCQFKDVPVPTYELLSVSEYRPDLEASWEHMLRHQLPALPPFQTYWDELPLLFSWLAGDTEEELMPVAPAMGGEDLDWSPPPTLARWNAGVPLEAVRFAAVNRLLVELGYQGRTRLIEPYSLRRARTTGNVVLHARRADTGEHRSYIVPRMESVRVTNTPFTPVYAIEFSREGPMAAPPTRLVLRGPRSVRTPNPRPRRSSTAQRYRIRCSVCGKHFYRDRPGAHTLRAHKAPWGGNCSGRRGYPD